MAIRNYAQMDIQEDTQYARMSIQTNMHSM